jgi:hypothetical protein
MKVGLTCSNPGCRIFTGAPESNIGVASHISAASPLGPRYDPSLTTQQRRSEENGIWLCQGCAKLVDSRALDKQYPCQLLSLWKQIAQHRASAYVGNVSPFLGDLQPVSIEHGRLLQISSAKDEYQLFNAVSGLPYTERTTLTARAQVRVHRSPKTLLEWASEIIISCWEKGDAELLGICTVLLSTSPHEWHPEDMMLTKLESLCHREIDAGGLTRVGIVEPLVFALAEKGRSAVYRRFLEVSVERKDWRNAEDARSSYYYRSEGEKAAAIFRHLRDPNRVGLLRANDVGRLLTLTTRPTFDLSHLHVRSLLIGLLTESVKELHNAGEAKLANFATRYLLSNGIDLESDEQPDDPSST